MTAADPVNHSKHYNAHPSGVECIQVIDHSMVMAMHQSLREGMADFLLTLPKEEQ